MKRGKFIRTSPKQRLLRRGWRGIYKSVGGADTTRTNLPRYPDRKGGGRFIVLEGVDGSGKSTQFTLLQEALKKLHISFVPIKFPQYGTPSAFFVEQYLKGEYGSADELGSELPSVFYAMDRFQAGAKIRKYVSEGKLVLADRYFASNLGHQGAKIRDLKKRQTFMKWIHHLEFDIFKIPKPDVNILLRVPPQVSLKLLKAHGKKRDIHERSLSYIRRSYESYETAAKLFPKDFKVIDCAPDGQLMTIQEIHEIILNNVRKFLDK